MYGALMHIKLDRKSNFIEWYFDEFSKDPLFLAMLNTTEGSPYHREGDVGIHTNMVVAQYLSSRNSQSIWSTERLLGAFVCAFHDVGKPTSRITKHSEARGEYFSFAGHEKSSARLWENWACVNWKLLSDFELTAHDITKVGWMIEHHLPWGIKKDLKIQALCQTAVEYGILDVFVQVLRADTRGRTSDDAVEKRQKTEAWIGDLQVLAGNTYCGNLLNDEYNNYTTFLQRYPELKTTSNAEYEQAADRQIGTDQHPEKFCILPIAPSGSGKSTLYNKLISSNPTLDVHSLDVLRHDWYDAEDYAKAFSMSCDDKNFNTKAQRSFMEKIDSGSDIFVDNVNVSAKRRRFYTTQAKQKGYVVVSVLMPVQLDVVINRQESRSDKTVPSAAVTQQYNSLQQPQYGRLESDIIITMDHNLHK